MELAEALKTRRSVRRFTNEPISKTTVQSLLDFAPWVPNHHLTEPWRFIVIQGESLKELAVLRQQAVLKKRAGEPNAAIRGEKAREEFVQSAVVIAVIQSLDPNPTRRDEDYAAMAMATYNIMLAAWDQGIGSYWNTGPLVHDEAVRSWLHLSPEERLIALIRLGRPELIPQARRTPLESRIQWRN